MHTGVARRNPLIVRQRTQLPARAAGSELVRQQRSQLLRLAIGPRRAGTLQLLRCREQQPHERWRGTARNRVELRVELCAEEERVVLAAAQPTRGETCLLRFSAQELGGGADRSTTEISSPHLPVMVRPVALSAAADCGLTMCVWQCRSVSFSAP